MFEIQIDLNHKRFCQKTVISEIIISNIDFYVNSMNVAAISMISLTKLSFHNFIFLITKNASAKIIKQTSSYLYSNNVSNLVLRDKRINAIITL